MTDAQRRDGVIACGTPPRVSSSSAGAGLACESRQGWWRDQTTLADGTHGDVPIVAGESGVAGLAALQALMASNEGRRAAGLGDSSRVLVVNTEEGATAPGVYAGILGRPAEAVLQAQQGWLGRHGIVTTAPM